MAGKLSVAGLAMGDWIRTRLTTFFFFWPGPAGGGRTEEASCGLVEGNGEGGGMDRPGKSDRTEERNGLPAMLVASLAGCYCEGMTGHDDGQASGRERQPLMAAVAADVDETRGDVLYGQTHAH